MRRIINKNQIIKSQNIINITEKWRLNNLAESNLGPRTKYTSRVTIIYTKSHGFPSLAA